MNNQLPKNTDELFVERHYPLYNDAEPLQTMVDMINALAPIIGEETTKDLKRKVYSAFEINVRDKFTNAIDLDLVKDNYDMVKSLILEIEFTSTKPKQDGIGSDGNNA